MKKQKISIFAGSLHVVYGPMFSGKTTKCAELLSEYADIGLKTCYINSNTDTRSDTSFSSNRSGCNIYMSDKVVQIKTCDLAAINVSEFQVIGIDECQFFPELVSFVTYWVETLEKTVIAVGLSGNYRREKYGRLLDLIPMADYSEHLTARCKAKHEDSDLPCGVVTAAPFTLLLDDGNEETIVGDKQLYAPVCRYHYKILIRLSPVERVERISN